METSDNPAIVVGPETPVPGTDGVPGASGPGTFGTFGCVALCLGGIIMVANAVPLNIT